jgi:hypothetical protein
MSASGQVVFYAGFFWPNCPEKYYRSFGYELNETGGLKPNLSNTQEGMRFLSAYKNLMSTMPLRPKSKAPVLVPGYGISVTIFPR